MSPTRPCVVQCDTRGAPSDTALVWLGDAGSGKRLKDPQHLFFLHPGLVADVLRSFQRFLVHDLIARAGSH